MQDGLHLPTALAVAALFVLLHGGLWLRRRRVARGFLSEADRIIYETLRTGSQAARYLREGLTEDTATKSARHLRLMLGGSALAFCDTQGLLVWTGHGEHHSDQSFDHAGRVLRTGEVVVLRRSDLPCHRPECDVRAGVVAPLV